MPCMTARKTPWTLCLFIVSCSLAFTTASAATTEQWRHRSIYQIVTDRFARSDDASTAPCNAAAGDYCGGSFRGIIDRLDYIQDLGFSAVSPSPSRCLHPVFPFISNCALRRFGSHPSRTRFKKLPAIFRVSGCACLGLLF